MPRQGVAVEQTSGVDAVLPSGYAVFAPPSEFDLAAAPAALGQLRRLIETTSPRIVVDMSEVDFVDSSGLRALVRAHQLAQQQDGAVVLSGASRTLLRLLAITGLDQVLVAYASVDDVH